MVAATYRSDSDCRSTNDQRFRRTAGGIASCVLRQFPMALPPVPHLADSIVVGQIQTPLDGAMVVDPSTPARTALKELRSRNFDQAPVLSDGLPIGYVLARDLEHTRGPVEAHVRLILP